MANSRFNNGDVYLNFNDETCLDLKNKAYFNEYWDNFSSLYNSKYFSETQFVNSFSRSNKFLALSLNIQSINAKYDSFKNFTQQLMLNEIFPSIICLQEI